MFISAHSLGGPGPVLVLTGVWIYFNRPLMGSVCQQLPTCYSLPHTGWYTSANGPTVCLCANTWYTPGALDSHFAPNIVPFCYSPVPLSVWLPWLPSSPWSSGHPGCPGYLHHLGHLGHPHHTHYSPHPGRFDLPPLPFSPCSVVTQVTLVRCTGRYAKYKLVYFLIECA